MKRLISPILWIGVVSLLFLALLVVQTRTSAKSGGRVSLQRKISKDIVQKAAMGRGNEFVRVII